MITWIDPAPKESYHQTTERLVLHGWRCGVRTARELAMHAGLRGANDGRVDSTARVTVREILQKHGLR